MHCNEVTPGKMWLSAGYRNNSITFDEVSKILLKNYDKIKHHHKELIRKDSLKAGTYLGVYPTIVKDTVEMVRKKYIC